MTRTQVYLTDDGRARLDAIALRTGRNRSDLIRDALEQYLMEKAASDRQRSVQTAAGLWADRQDLPDFAQLRREWDRAMIP